MQASKQGKIFIAFARVYTYTPSIESFRTFGSKLEKLSDFWRDIPFDSTYTNLTGKKERKKKKQFKIYNEKSRVFIEKCFDTFERELYTHEYIHKNTQTRQETRYT